MQRHFILTAFFLPAFAAAAVAADCDDQAAGPQGTDSKFYYSSSCFRLRSDRVRLAHKVCSVSNSTLVFYWTKLNWVSGATGVEFGNCLTREHETAKAIRIGGSSLRSNQASPYVSDVFLPDLKDGNQTYTETVEGGGPRIEGGSKKPFRFSVSYAPNKDKKTVQIRAGMNGDKPVFYLVLPRSVKSRDDLNKFIDSDQIKTISPLIDFGDKPLVARAKDSILADFLKENNVADRGVIAVASLENRATLDVTVNGTLEEVAGGMGVCLSQADVMITCFGSSPL